MTSNDEKKLESLFKGLDKNGDGTLSKDEIEEGYDALGIPAPAILNELLKKLDKGNGIINYIQFLISTQDWSKLSQMKDLETTFKIYDKGGDGTLSLEELKEAIPGIHDSEWEALLSEADTNKDGLISLEELKVYLTKKSS
jgi:Ca2+-binding EF-hand superfamily protein